MIGGFIFLKKSNKKMIYTILVFIALAAFDNIIIGLFPPLFQYIAQDLNVGVAKLGIISAVTILVTAVSSVYSTKKAYYAWNVNLGPIRIPNIHKSKFFTTIILSTINWNWFRMHCFHWV